MSDYSKLPIVFLYTDSRDSVDGATKFQKLVFIAQEEDDLGEFYPFHADKFGPFSPDLHKDLEALRIDGLIERNVVPNEVGNEKYVYSLTTRGIHTAQELVKAGNDRLFEIVTGVKKEYNNMPLPDLIRYVYGKYPEYTTSSELDIDTLFDPDARSQFLEYEREYVGTEPSEWKDLNPSAEELFSTDD